MALFAIGDLHLAFSMNKPMNKFGKQWENHHIKIKNNWTNLVKSYDTVIIPGDISWAMTENEAELDLNFIKELPGNKVIIKGNHDFWWNKTGFLNDKYKENMYFLRNNSYIYNDIAIAGTRGWTCPNDTSYTLHDEKIYFREQQRLKMSIEHAISKKCKDIIVVMHYPPTNDKRDISGFVEIIQYYNIKKVIYGHLHGEKSYNNSINGVYNGIEYILSSSDYLDFSPIKID